MKVSITIGGSSIDEVLTATEQAAAAGFTSAWLANIFGVDAGRAEWGRTRWGISPSAARFRVKGNPAAGVAARPKAARSTCRIGDRLLF